jgi:hypothetical protein
MFEVLLDVLKNKNKISFLQIISFSWIFNIFLKFSNFLRIFLDF